MRRIVGRLDTPDIVPRLAGLPAPDLSTFLLEVAGVRASRADPTDVLRRYRTDRFSRPAVAPFLTMRAVERAFINAVSEDWRWITPSPVLPFGSHAALGDITQDWVVTTVRGSEVAADPTVALALEAAAARSESARRRTEPPQKLVAIQRVLRGQLYSAPDAFTHFAIFGMVTAGRSRPGNRFDVDALTEHLGVYVRAVSTIAESLEIVLSVAGTSDGSRLLETVREAYADRADVDVKDDSGRLPAQRYYRRACFKVNLVVGGHRIEVGDGGFTDWTERLLGDSHERLLISGAGLERPALALHARAGSEDGR
jgi:hypothetical protein